MKLKKSSFVFLLIFSISFTFLSAQTPSGRAELVEQMCKSLERSSHLEDAERLEMVMNNYLYPYLDRLQDGDPEKVGYEIYMRLQSKCLEFSDLLHRLYPVYGDWERIYELPESKLDKKSCKRISKYGKLWYLESTDGSKVFIDLGKKTWVDKFADGTSSKLDFKWIDACEFEISFVESTNPSRKAICNPGDTFRYRLIEIEGEAYKTTLEIPGTEDYSSFKIYFEN
ncbi:MAG: hypothetical protein NXI20_09840 [bacterium]|nr:hypothetical protein [bacterium]